VETKDDLKMIDDILEIIEEGLRIRSRIFILITSTVDDRKTTLKYKNHYYLK
jgi:hypothetical protein